MIKKEQELQMWKDWKSTGDMQHMNNLLESLNPLIQREVNVFKTSPLPQEAIKLRALIITKNALEDYDPTKSQINTHLINNLKKLNRFVYENQNIGKIPEHRILKITQFKSIKEQLREQLNREPTTFDIANEMKLPPAEVERLEQELRQDLTIMNEAENEEGGGFYYLDPQVYTDKTKEAVHFVYYSLSDPTDQQLMEYYFGMFGKEKLPIVNIANKLKITHNKASKRLKELADMVQQTETNLM